jgi:16S rRNA (guanine527-N7)-methyltransferase
VTIAELAKSARDIGVVLDEGQLADFAAYRDLVLAAAERFNLTAVRDPGEVERRHFLEALALGATLVRLGVLAPAARPRVIDVGSGAGLPGLPVKIAWPEVEMALLESNEKRCRFLRETIARLGLAGAKVLEGRAETWARHRDHRERYDLALARAVAPLPVLLEYALPFLRVGGWLAAPKGSAAPRELAASGRALAELGGGPPEALPFEPPGGRPQTLVLVQKVSPTPERYPRRQGVPSRRPI